MCMVSAVTPSLTAPDIWRQIETLPYRGLSDLQKILDKLDKLDKRMGLLECRDAEKEAFFKALNELIAAKVPKKRARKAKRSGV